MKAVIACLALGFVAVALGATITCRDIVCASPSTAPWGTAEAQAKDYNCAPGSQLYVNVTGGTVSYRCRSDFKNYGADCTTDSFCGPFKSCVTVLPATTPSTSICRGTGRIGDSCSADNECVAPRTCTNGKCATSVAVGGSCAPAANTYTPVCPLGSYCKGGATPTCTTYSAVDTTCATGEQCGSGLVCSPSTQKCIAAFSLPNGASVGSGGSAYCASAYSKSGNCTTAPTDTSKLGQACTDSDVSSTGGCGTDTGLGCSCKTAATSGNTAICRANYIPASMVDAAKTWYSNIGKNCENSQDDPSNSKACVNTGYKQYICSVAKFQAGGSFPTSACPSSFSAEGYCNGAGRVGVSIIALVALIAAAFTAAF